MLLFGDMLVTPISGLLPKDMLRSGGSEIEALSCEESEEVMALAPAKTEEFGAEGQALASCIYVAIVVVVAQTDKHCSQSCEVPPISGVYHGIVRRFHHALGQTRAGRD